jgi:hypothetical protein
MTTHLSNKEIQRLCDQSTYNSRLRRMEKELTITKRDYIHITLWCVLITLMLVGLALLTGTPVNP